MRLQYAETGYTTDSSIKCDHVYRWDFVYHEQLGRDRVLRPCIAWTDNGYSYLTPVFSSGVFL